MTYDIDLYLNGAQGILIPCICDFCGKNFYRDRRRISSIHLNGQTNIFCNRKCHFDSRKTTINLICKNCEISFEKLPSQVLRTINDFCSKSCAATYNNTHKSKGTRRSKLEIWLESQLTNLYPTLKILYSDKSTINSELDIYIPSLNLAFELNGIFHYEPIYGEDKLNQIQNNDGRKFQACLEHNIELCILDTSSQKYFKESTSQKYLDIITRLVASKLEASKTDYVEVV